MRRIAAKRGQAKSKAKGQKPNVKTADEVSG